MSAFGLGGGRVAVARKGLDDAQFVAGFEQIGDHRLADLQGPQALLLHPSESDAGLGKVDFFLRNQKISGSNDYFFQMSAIFVCSVKGIPEADFLKSCENDSGALMK
jgi:hypothetical protein